MKVPNKEKYEPGKDFFELFSRMMGESLDINEKLKSSNPPNKTACQSKEKVTEQKNNIKADFTEAQKEKRPEYQKDTPIRSTVFERFGRPIEENEAKPNPQASRDKNNLSKESQKIDEQKRESSDKKASVFEKLSPQ